MSILERILLCHCSLVYCIPASFVANVLLPRRLSEVISDFICHVKIPQGRKYAQGPLQSIFPNSGRPRSIAPTAYKVAVRLPAAQKDFYAPRPRPECESHSIRPIAPHGFKKSSNLSRIHRSFTSSSSRVSAPIQILTRSFPFTSFNEKQIASFNVIESDVTPMGRFLKM